ncbi:SDR family oxidoreductase [Caldicellulosiruptor naganoensis]|uniref:SDR family oxidoreductase n=1 Tax=Caldicellulosiruptor naganoensis TaxID=29324 RepID=A0ABY7BFN6_9FIRM|nr:SDR family oxidoreductase [Caldicellulosiruptor naganoensis]WAM31628.1 SDR family oxidoreductase [Caldicellulosiruptor naganoensis]
MEFLTMPEFKDKVVVVTGAAQGIGLVTALSFLNNGAYVAAVDVDREAIEDAMQDFFKGYEDKIEFFECDLQDASQIERVCRKIGEKYKSIDVLVNNAGVGSTKWILDRTVEEWDYVINVNLRAPYLMVKYLLPFMKEGSCIVNIASTRALMSEPNTEPYSASKGGILALTHSLAVSLSHLKIRVNAISPGWIEVSEYKKRKYRKLPDLREIDHLQHPAGRGGKPEDVANAVLFLASEKSGFITGTNLVVDGGMTIKMIYEE